MMGAALQDGPLASSRVSGKQLRAVRLRAGLSLEKLGSNFRKGVTRQAIHSIENQAVVSEQTALDFRTAIRRFENLKNKSKAAR
jgi:predicted transcriptional regulator